MAVIRDRLPQNVRVVADLFHLQDMDRQLLVPGATRTTLSGLHFLPTLIRSTFPNCSQRQISVAKYSDDIFCTASILH